MHTMNRMERVEKFVRDIGLVEEGDVDFSRTVDLFDYGYLDSFGIIELISLVQEEYGVDLGEADFYGDNIRSIDAIAAYIGDHIQ